MILSKNCATDHLGYLYWPVKTKYKLPSFKLLLAWFIFPYNITHPSASDTIVFFTVTGAARLVDLLSKFMNRWDTTIGKSECKRFVPLNFKIEIIRYNKTSIFSLPNIIDSGKGISKQTSDPKWHTCIWESTRGYRMTCLF